MRLVPGAEIGLDDLFVALHVVRAALAIGLP